MNRKSLQAGLSHVRLRQVELRQVGLRQKVLALVILAPAVLTGCEVSFSVPKPEDIPGFQGENQASFVMNAMAAGQEAYYEANGHFSSSVESLAINFNLETEDYAYSIVTEGDYAQTVVMKAAAKLDGLPSYAGVVTVGQSEGGVMAMANICKTDKPSTQAPDLSPTPVPGEGLKCPRGSSPVQ
ncbi:MAG: type IV pilin-like G/H family protein [Microcoleaceae cyanobacterium]